MDVNESIYIESKLKATRNVIRPRVCLVNDLPLLTSYAKTAEGAAHGGMDSFVFNAIGQAVKQMKQTSIDFYDSLTLSLIMPLSGTRLKNEIPHRGSQNLQMGNGKIRKVILHWVAVVLGLLFIIIVVLRLYCAGM
jgi:hypothetical protein